MYLFLLKHLLTKSRYFNQPKVLTIYLLDVEMVCEIAKNKKKRKKKTEQYCAKKNYFMFTVYSKQPKNALRKYLMLPMLNESTRNKLENTLK